MQVVTLVIEFEDGRKMAFIGPHNDVLEQDFAIKAVGFSSPHELPDCKLSDIQEMVYEEVTTH